MIDAFLASWPLFRAAYLTGWLLGVLLSLGGVLVVAREQIFIGAAVAQAATLGIAIGLVLREVLPEGRWLRADAFLSCMAVACSVLAALLTAHHNRPGRESHEAMTGWVFLGASSYAMLVVTHSPHGMAEIQRLLSSSLIGATVTDVWVFGMGAVITVVTLLLTYRRLVLCALDPAMAAAVGLRVSVWSAGFTVWLGLTVGMAIRVSGVLYTFGCLILPALIAKNLCREVRSLFVVAPLVAVILGVVGAVLADATDTPPAQMTVALFSLTLAVIWGVRWWYER